MDAALDATLACVGNRLRAARSRRSLTLAEVSEETGVSISTLSRIESGDRKITLELLLPLARLYDTPLDDLVGGPPTDDPRVPTRKANLPGITLTGVSQPNSGLHVFKHILRPVSKQPLRPEKHVHSGTEWIYVLGGELRLILGHREHTFATGQAAQFDGRTPHWFGNALDHDTTEFLGMFSAAGSRIHALPLADDGAPPHGQASPTPAQPNRQ